MRCELFGDIRDLFKYDLAIAIARAMRLEFIFVPMLTRDRDKDGNQRHFDRAIKQGRPGTKNQSLVGYLQQHEDRAKRCIQHIKSYFDHEGVGFYLHEHAQHDDGIFFSHQDRAGYFGERLTTSLSSALLFVDPDNGLQIKSSTEQHLLFRDVENLLKRLGDDSVLMIYQQFRRRGEWHGPYTNRRLTELSRVASQPPCCISDNEILFFFLTKTASCRRGLVDVLHQYHQRYPDRTVVSGC